MAEPIARPQLTALTGVRAVAAAWVLLLHGQRLLEAALPAARVLRPLASRGYLGVDLFFVLSGFVLAFNYLDGMARPTWAGVRTFLWARVARIYPLHLVTLGVVVAGYVAAPWFGRSYGPAAEHEPAQLPAQLLLAQAWTWAERPTFNAPSWSVSAEWAAYLAFPLLAVLVARVRSPRAAALAAAAGLGFTFATLGGLEPGSLDVTTRGGLLRIAGEFSAGVCLLQVYRAWQPSLREAALCTSASVLAIAGALALELCDAVVVTTLAASVLALARAQGPVDRLISSSTMQSWGQRSYALYMTHGITLHLYEAAIGGVAALDRPLFVRLALLGGGLGLVLLVSAASFRWVEEPGRRLLREAGRAARRTSREPVPSAAPQPSLRSS